jgi:hypothetical protein
MKRWLFAVTVLCALFMAIISGVQAQGAQAASGKESRLSTITREFQLIDGQWCWRGLCLEQTPLTEASRRLRDKTMFGDIIKVEDQGTSSVSWQWDKHPDWYSLVARPRNGNNISHFSFSIRDAAFSLADALRLFGTPQAVYIQGIGGDLMIEICFAHEACMWIVQHTGLINPDAQIIGIDFMTAEAFKAQVVYGVDSIPWRGFTNYTPGWWYRFVN